MKKISLKELRICDSQKLSGEEKKDVLGGLNILPPPIDIIEFPRDCPIGTMPVWVGCSYGGGVVCKSCEEMGSAATHPNCLILGFPK